MTITKQTVADKIAAYLHHEMTLAQLVDWAENALLDGEFAEGDARILSSVIGRLGVADVRAFGLAWDDCEELLHQLGFCPRVEVVFSRGTPRRSEMSACNSDFGRLRERFL